jgi:hypothetical protein
VSDSAPPKVAHRKRLTAEQWASELEEAHRIAVAIEIHVRIARDEMRENPDVEQRDNVLRIARMKVRGWCVKLERIMSLGMP